MLNLLFISNSPKADYIKTTLQPLLKVIIDVVPDFDHGLKDVFEKRPSAVCIQEQISGITGESVARHIQMLLGTGSPTFILMHEGSSKAKIIKGLCEYLIDLTLPEGQLIEEVVSTLKALLGDQWEKVYIPPKKSAEAIRAAVNIPEESKADANKLVDDFLSDLESTGFTAVAEAPSFLQPEEEVKEGVFTPVSNVDELTSMLQDQAHNTIKEEQEAKVPDHVVAEPFLKPVDLMHDKGIEAEPASSAISEVKESAAPSTTPEASSEKIEAVAVPALQTGNPEKVIAVKPGPALTGQLPAVEKAVSPSTPESPAVALSDFRFADASDDSEDQLPDDFLLTFDESYRSSSTRRYILIGLIGLLLMITGGSWYIINQKPELWFSLQQRFGTLHVPPAQPVQAPSKPSATSAGSSLSEKKQSVNPVLPPSSPHTVESAKTVAPPSFIPSVGLDRGFSLQKPGWERYVGKREEFRLFRADGKIVALQVMAMRGNSISESRMKSMLHDFLGASSYTVISTEAKSGFKVLHATGPAGADLSIYRYSSGIRAFVVAVK